MDTSQIVIVMTHPFVTLPKIVHGKDRKALLSADLKVISFWRKTISLYLLGERKVFLLVPYAQKNMDIGRQILRTCRQYKLDAFVGEPNPEALAETLFEKDASVLMLMIQPHLFNGACVELHRKMFRKGHKFAYTKADLANGALCIFDQSRSEVLIKIG